MSPSPLWEPTDEVTLVAWLDFCVRNHVIFQDTIIDRLKENRERQTGKKVVFGFRQVKHKLINLSTKYSVEKVNSRWAQILQQGSVYFPRLPTAIRHNVDTAVINFQTEYANLLSINGPDNYSQHIVPVSGQQAATADFEAALSHPESSSNAGDRIRIEDRIHESQRSRGKHDKYAGNQYKETNRPQEQERPKTHGSIRLQTLEEPCLENPETRNIMKEWETDVEMLTGKIGELEHKNQRLLAMIQHSDNARLARETASKDPKESEIRQYHRQLWDLEQRNAALQGTVRFFKEIPARPRSLTTQEIDEAMDLIGSELESMLHGNDTSTLRTPVVTSGSDLESLIQAYLNPRHRQTPKSWLNECILTHEAPVVVRILALAALRDWVFSTDYPNFAADGVSSSLLKYYRKIAYEIGDWISLRNYDIAAYYQLINSDEFQEYSLPRKAIQLADRLVRTLSPMFVPPADSYQETTISSLEQSEDLQIGLRFRFVEMFKAGLNFKAATVMTDSQYLFMVHDPRTSAHNGLGNSPKDAFRLFPPSPKETFARCWLHATLRVFEAGFPNMLDRQADAVVQTENFISSETDFGASNCLHEKSITIERAEPAPCLPGLRSDGPRQPGEIYPNTGTSSQTQGQQLSQVSGHIYNHNGLQTGQQNNALTKFTPAQLETVGSQRQPNAEIRSMQSNADAAESTRSDPTSMDNLAEAEENPASSALSAREAQVKSNHSLYTCSVCEREFSLAQNLKRHEKKNQCSRCVACKETFRCNSVLMKHLQAAHPGSAQAIQMLPPNQLIQKKTPLSCEPKSGSLQCEKCGQTFTRQENLRKHLSREVCVKVCRECKLQFRSRLDLQKHIKEDHARSPSKVVMKSKPKPKNVHLTESLGTNQLDTRNDLSIESQNDSIYSQSEISGQSQINAGDEMKSGAGQSDSVHSTKIPPTRLSSDDQYVCTPCGRTFKAKSGFERHERTDLHVAQMRYLESQTSSPNQTCSKRTLSDPENTGQLPAKRVARNSSGAELTRQASHPKGRRYTQVRRELTPPTRHVARILAEVAKVGEIEVTSRTAGTEPAVTSVPPSTFADEIPALTSLGQRK